MASLKYIKGFFEDFFFEQIFPNELIEDNLIIRSDGNPAAGFYLDLVERETLGEQDIIVLQESLDRVFSRLPVGTTVHFQTQYFHSTNKARPDKAVSSFIQRKLGEYLNDRPVLESRTVMYITFDFTKGKTRNPANTFFSNIQRLIKNPLKDVSKNKELAQGYLQSFLVQFSAVKGLTATRMSNEDLPQERTRYFNLDFAGPGSRIEHTFENRGNEMAVGENLLRVVFLRRSGNELYKTSTSDRGVTTFMPWPMGHYLSFPHVVNFAFTICDSEKEMKALEVNRNVRKALGSLQGQVDRLIVQDIEAFTQGVRQSNKVLVHMNHNVMTWSPDPAKLSYQVDMIKTAYTRMNTSVGLTEAYNAGNYFFTYAGGMALDMFSTLLMPLDEALLHYDFSGGAEKEQRGVVFCNRELEPVVVDLWSPKLPNFNRITVGVTGAGKSFAMGVIAAQEIDQGVHMVIIDKGRSYYNLYLLYQDNARYYDYNVDSRICFNPFLLQKDRAGRYDLTESKVIFLLTFLTLMWKDTAKGESMNKEEQSVFSKLLHLYFEEVNLAPGLNRPRLDAFVRFVVEYYKTNSDSTDLRFIDLASFLLVIDKFIVGQYAAAVNSDDNENIVDKRVVIFDVDGLQADPLLYPIVCMMIIELVMDKAREIPTIKKEIIIEEAWSMLPGNTFGPFIESSARTLRKFLGSLNIVSQSIFELRDSPIGAIVKAMSATTILLDHSSQPAMYPELQRFFGLTDQQLQQLKSIRNNGSWRELMVIRGSVAQVFAIDVGPSCGAAFSSWSTDRSKIVRLAQKSGVEYAINQFVEDQTNS